MLILSVSAADVDAWIVYCVSSLNIGSNQLLQFITYKDDILLFQEANPRPSLDRKATES